MSSEVSFGNGREINIGPTSSFPTIIKEELNLRDAYIKLYLLFKTII
jgi:hypothetical protein